MIHHAKAYGPNLQKVKYVEKGSYTSFVTFHSMVMVNNSWLYMVKSKKILGAGE